MIGFILIMGVLYDGYLMMVCELVSINDIIIVSVFVNLL